MKVLLTTDLYLPVLNGVVTSIVTLKEELEAHGHEVKILTLSHSSKSYYKNNVYYLKSIPFNIYPDVRLPITYLDKYLDELIDWHPDVIHSHCEFFSFIFAKRIHKKTGAPLIHTYHTLYEQYVQYIMKIGRVSEKMVATMTNYVLRYVDLIVVPTNKVKLQLEDYGVRKKLAIIPTGIDMTKYSQVLSEQQRQNLLVQYQIPQDVTVFLSVCRLGYEKNVKEIIQHFYELSKKTTDIFLLIVGDGPARQELEEQVAMLNMTDKVCFTGAIARSEIWQYYQLGDIFVSASTSETQGLTYVEALASGLPLLCKKDHCLDEVVFNGKNGYQYDSNEQFSLYALTLLNNETMIEKSHQFNCDYRQRFSKQVFGEQIIAVYREAINMIR